MTEAAEMKGPSWGATWLLPDKWSASWGARAIADQAMLRPGEDLIAPTHIANLDPARVSGAGRNKDLDDLIRWINQSVLPIRINYDGASTDITILDDGSFHARWTPNGSHGYLYVVAWKD